MTSAEQTILRTMLGSYSHTLPLKQGAVKSDRIALEFVEIKPTSKAFKPMVRELAFDVCEMAIVTFLQAKAYGKPLVLLPAVMLGRFQHGCMLYNSERGTIAPSDLAGKRIGVRAYSQTTGVWVRGILSDDYGVDVNRARWITFEDAHVAEYRDPPQVERSTSDKDLTAMLLAGEIDAAIYGNDIPKDPRLKSVIPDPEHAAQGWYAKHQAVPVNHLVVVKRDLAQTNPQAIRELYDLLRRAKDAGSPITANGTDLVPFGIEANRTALQLIIDYALQQQLIPRRMTVDDLFDDSIKIFAT
ncbi:MAG TPA: hypothetical protein VHN11_00115 [Xanthobacteraceae bacterium]|jgi:4,5-dihydroxyphthalate decarboxylase|nr:hypothetical protein [Xanthobacteraceae bacterium]